MGRILATLLVILFGPWTTGAFAILYTPVWLIGAVVILKSVWKKERLDDDSAPGSWRERNRAHHPLMLKPVGGKWVGPAALALVAVGYVFMMIRMGTVGRFVLMALTLCAGLGLFLAWTADV